MPLRVGQETRSCAAAVPADGVVAVGPRSPACPQMSSLLYASGQGVVCATRTTAASGVRCIRVFWRRVVSSSCSGMAYPLVAGSLPSYLEAIGFDVKDRRDLG